MRVNGVKSWSELLLLWRLVPRPIQEAYSGHMHSALTMRVTFLNQICVLRESIVLRNTSSELTQNPGVLRVLLRPA